MEMSQVRYFLALLEEGRFTRAARRCGIAQPSLTRAIKLLEAELGGRLFVREVSGVRPTALGERVEPNFRAILKEVAAVERVRRNSAAARRSNGKGARDGSGLRSPDLGGGAPAPRSQPLPPSD
jgi:LysR family transcriptional regulator, hydrogen peroxide-inducible genes activator